MLRLASYDIVFQEIPGEVTLALNLSACPNACPGCHSPHLQEAVGESLDETLLDDLLVRYASGVTCVCFMGGDIDPCGLERLATAVRRTHGSLKVGWYSGRKELPTAITASAFDYIKLGPYIAKFGGLDNPATNQRFYAVIDGELIDRTASFWK